MPNFYFMFQTPVRFAETFRLTLNMQQAADYISSGERRDYILREVVKRIRMRWGLPEEIPVKMQHGDTALFERMGVIIPPELQLDLSDAIF